MNARKLVLVFVALVLTFVLAACAAPEPTKAPAPVAAPTTAPAQPTVPPKPTEAAGPKKGGTLTMVVWQEPENLNQNLSTMTVVGYVAELAIEGLVAVDNKGAIIPVLATEVPSLANGGLSADGKTITYKLRKTKWHDGTDFTCDDLVFTRLVQITPNSGSLYAIDFANIDTIDCPNPNSAVVKLKNPRGDWWRYFSGLGYAMPKNAGKPEEFKTWAYNRKPIGTGPYKVTEFITGDHITFDRNPNYWQEGKPYIDKVVVRIVPSSEVGLQLLKSGETDVMWNNTEADLPALEKMPNVALFAAPQPGGERLILNLTKPGDPSDNKTPHPILGDLKVRQAIAYGIDKDSIIKNVLNGKAIPGAGELNIDPYNCNIKPYAFDVAKAKQLLDEAGWKPGADGIRVKDGQRLRIKYQTTTGNKLREDSQVLVVENMKAIGVEFFIENQPSSLLIGSWGANSPRKKGNFDIIMYTTNAAIDPHSQMFNYFHSKNIPSADNQGGANYSRWNDPETDKLIDQAGALFDWPKRKDLYCQAAARVVDGASHIYLYGRMTLQSFNTRVQGWLSSSWDGPLWNIADQWLK
jgi:peptide/nickel transport system substrate-binding protein